jgi:hydroxymethylpyrimidine kinase/phosphomethylpyrimidine kinase/thiamine-phosphate diphosphorylase
MKRFDPSVYWITDIPGGDSESALAVAERAARAGVTVVQVRSKSASRDEQVTWTRALVARLRPLGVAVLVNDHVDVAREAGADGVHLGQSDEDVRNARRTLGDDAIVGLSVTTLGEALRVPLDVVDYVAPGPIFATRSKNDAATPLGLEGLAAIRDACPLPLVAIGGVNAETAESVLTAGADGLAAVEAFAVDPAETAERFRRAVARARRARRPRALTIAGSDSGGGAGIQADLKTFEALGVYGASALTAVTAQDTTGVAAVLALEPSLVRAQAERVLDDIGADAIKLGMLANAGIVAMVAELVAKRDLRDIALDPVLVAKSGDFLLERDAVDVLRERLLPQVALVTPNLPEAEALLGRTIESRASMEAAARALAAIGPAVLLKGGHLRDADAPDYFFCRQSGDFWIESPRVRSRNTHGTGCTLSAAVTAYRARGLSWAGSVVFG